MNTSGEPLVVADGLTKTFDATSPPAVDALCFRIEPGRVTGLVGPDGAGKTTLLRLVAGLLLPTSGSLRTCGIDTGEDLDAIRRVVSYMPQRFGLYEDLTVAENLAFHADLRAVVGEERRRTAARLLEFTGLGPFTDRLAGRLSGGMKQKLGLACALVRKPDLLLLDEPSVGVDPISRRELWKLVYDLVDQGIAVVWSTAYLDEAERCGSVLTLDRGRILFDGPPRDLTARAEGRSYLVRGADRKRRVLAAASRLPAVVDGVIQGRSVRLVLAEGAAPPGLDEIDARGPDPQIVPTAARFEDAFVDLLGGGPKGGSPLAGELRPADAGEGPMVEARDLTKRFGAFTAADRVSFQIGRGEIFGLLGPNGAGKSTTFKMLCGLLKPTEGSARVAGADLSRTGGAARARLGYMAQKFSLYGDLSTRQNLDFFSGVYGLAGARRRATIGRMVDAFELQPYMDLSAGGLPLGFKQRLALACAILHDPPVLFLDEPTSGVDPLTRREFWSHINAMVERGATVLVTTHFLDEAEYCDRVALVYRGRVIAAGSPDDLKESVRTAENPEPTFEDAFVDLVTAFDADRGVA
ncbi:ATP-binding cassette domain-containing protein [Aquisphaera insulae]|uniref:ATP-binding cassette domain-containing protein n=1 Tax=Aquisphaera insulae TaxID=2712864 RepID=UPI0013EB26E9|nr:ATP-binding cassette domain-containing protein [Aquisphaera insulae]